MNIAAVIPARGGSKGIPRKNIVKIAGQPLIAYTIESALKSKLINRTIVSTDDAEVERISRQYGAEVVKRPNEISGDMATSESALMHVLDTLKKTEQYVPDLLVFLQCTSPLTLAEDVDGVINTLIDTHADTAFSVAPYHGYLWKTDKNGQAVGVNHDETKRLMRQQQKPQYLENGAVYVMNTAGFEDAKHRFFGKTVMFEMPPERCLDIDTPDDLRIAEILLKERQRKDSGKLPGEVQAIIFDFDGVFTDNKVIVFPDGKEGVVCDRSDGMGISLLEKMGMKMLVLSTEKNPVLTHRCQKLSLECIYGQDNKYATLQEWLKNNGVNAANAVYVGNDVNDLECMKSVGCSVAVADAHPDVLSSADIVLTNAGGKGAVRELGDMIIKKKGD